MLMLALINLYSWGKHDITQTKAAAVYESMNIGSCVWEVSHNAISTIITRVSFLAVIYWFNFHQNDGLSVLISVG
jgi:hypothetical protein